MEFILVIAIIVIIGFISSFVFKRIDLTSEKRHTLAGTTKNFLSDLENVVYVKVYLESDHLPSGLKKLQRSVKEMLDEFRVYAGDNIEYSFINPTESTDPTTRNEIVKQLRDNGMVPFSLQERDSEGGQSSRAVYPGAWITYIAHGQEYQQIVNFFKDNIRTSMEQKITSSIEDLEYEFVTAMTTITKENVDRIAFIEGHGELNENEVIDITRALEQFYIVERVKIDKKLNSLRPYKAIIIANPTEIIDPFDKYIIDQFIMAGGRSLWVLDPVGANMNDLSFQASAMAGIKKLSTDEMLFGYGARINSDIVQDQVSSLIPLNTSTDTLSPPVWKLFPFSYLPLAKPDVDHPLVRNLNSVKMEFASTIDTVGENPNVKKTILLESSDLTKVVRLPILVSIEMAIQRFGPEQSNKPNSALAVLLEGEFTSNYVNRLTDAFLKNDSVEIKFLEKSEPTKMIVVSDGDAIKNGTGMQDGVIRTLPLGYDRYTQMTFGNKEFFLNCINYLCDDSGMMNVRSREINIRRLHFDKINKDRLKWQMINMLVPIGLIAGFGFLIYYLRKKKYAQ